MFSDLSVFGLVFQKTSIVLFIIIVIIIIDRKNQSRFLLFFEQWLFNTQLGETILSFSRYLLNEMYRVNIETLLINFIIVLYLQFKRNFSCSNNMHTNVCKTMMTGFGDEAVHVLNIIVDQWF